jgi:D-sedoheptulose 7-phosphate isomerase
MSHGTCEDRLLGQLRQSAKTISDLSLQADAIRAAGRMLVEVLSAGGKVLTAGNGGSAAEALHLAEELTGRFRSDRRSLPGIALVADCTALTCIGNDYGFDFVFSRQVEGLGRPGDALVLFSTSGKARNLEEALGAAARAGVRTVGILGRDGGPLAGRADLEVIVPGTATERIQEAHQVILHVLLDMVEEEFAR